MARAFQTGIDLVRNELQNAILQNLGSAPASPVEGMMFWDSTLHRPQFWNANASAWQLKATDSDLLQGNNSAHHLDRTNHTGTQAASTISDFSSAVNAIASQKYSVNVGNGVLLTYTITHNLGTRDVVVQVYKAGSTYDQIECDVLHATINTVTLAFSVAPATDEYRCVVHG